jgi:peptidoglycan-associated lipoprotein
MRNLTLIIVLATLSACGARSKKAVTTADPAPRSGNRGGAAGDADATGPGAAPRFAAIHFGYDDAVLDAAARAGLEEVAAFLRKNPGATVTVAGHADERGTPEYNIALGEERARAARDYLVRLGVEDDRIRTVSHGEERPVVSGHDESSHAQNRRDELEVVLDAHASAD